MYCCFWNSKIALPCDKFDLLFLHAELWLAKYLNAFYITTHFLSPPSLQCTSWLLKKIFVYCSCVDTLQSTGML
jgi:hypothetical protein